MRHIKKLVGVLLGLLSIGAARTFLDRYEVLIFDKNDLEEEDEEIGMDLRGTPTHQCICGSNIWYVKAAFENYEIATYFLDMICATCGSLATAPTPVDREGMEY